MKLILLFVALMELKKVYYNTPPPPKKKKKTIKFLKNPLFPGAFS